MTTKRTTIVAITIALYVAITIALFVAIAIVIALFADS
jgi:hypothetical protein